MSQTMKIKVVDSGRCGADEGKVISVDTTRAERWIARGWAASLDAPTKTEKGEGGDSAPDALPTKKADLEALFKAEIGKDPADVLKRVTVKNLIAAIEEHREGAAE